MKTRLLTLLAIFCFVTSKAQYVPIPDPAFVSWLNNNGYSACMSGNQMDTTGASVRQATNLIIEDSAILNVDGVQYFDSVNYLYLNCIYLQSLSHIPNQVRTFFMFGSGQPMVLPGLPASITTMGIWSFNLDTLPALPPALYVLTLDRDSLSALPTLPSTLIQLICNHNKLTSLPVLPAGLTTLNIEENNISTLPALPNTIKYLILNDNLISSVPAWPTSCIRIHILNCPFTSVPPLPNALEDFTCQGTDISICPALPSTLELLNCSYTNVASLPAIPNSLKTLRIASTPITHIPQLPSFMQQLTCGQGQLTSITNFPDSLILCQLMGNANLKCLPKIGYIGTLSFSGTGIECLPNYGRVMNGNPSIYSLPLCDMFNENGCEMLADISGLVYRDANSNCVQNTQEPSLENVKVMLSGAGSNQYTYTSNFGSYSFDVNTNDTYQVNIDTTDIPFTVGCPLNGVHIDTLSITDSVSHDNDFAMICKTGIDVAALSISTPTIFRPANYTTVNVNAGDASNFYNLHCASGTAGTVTVTTSGPINYIGPVNGTLVPSSVNNNIITWNVTDFGTVDVLHDFNIVVRTDTFAQLGQQVCFTVSVTPTADNNPNNNTFTHCFTIVNSYDPNDKTAYPAGNIDTAQEWLTYTVRFQNTGNAEAQHIYVMDTLDTDVDASSFRLLAYSHQPNMQIKENIVRFNFPNINLPDSVSNEPGSHGYVQYKVKLKDGLPIGTEIKNTAFIYFDFNPPVVTNTTTNTIAEIEDTTIIGIKPIVNELSLNVYPNPANQSLNVSTSQAGNTLAIFNTQGKLMMKVLMNGSAETLNIAELTGGVYYVEVSSTKGTARKKFIKL